MSTAPSRRVDLSTYGAAARRLDIAQLAACVLLAGMGQALGALRVVAALGEQVGCRGALLAAGGAVCVGWCAGVLIPRRVVRRHFSRHPDADGAAGPVATGPRSADFAALLTAGLLMGLGIVMLAAAAFARGLPATSAFLTARFVHPPQVTAVLALLPTCLGIAAASAIAALALVAAAGWQRALRTGAGVVPLWGLLAPAAMLGAVAALGLAPRSATFTVLAAVFAAAGLATARRPVGDVGPDAGRSSEAAGSRGERVSRIPAVFTGLAAGIAAYGIAEAAPGEKTAYAELARAALWLAGAVWVGTLVAQAALRCGRRAVAGAPALLLPAAIVTAVGSTTATAALATGLCAAAAWLEAARTHQEFGRVPPALARTGAALGVGALAGLLVAALRLLSAPAFT